MSRTAAQTQDKPQHQLVDEVSQEQINIGDSRLTFRGERVTVVDFYVRPAPSTGRVVVKFEDGSTGEYYPSVIRAAIVEV